MGELYTSFEEIRKVILDLINSNVISISITINESIEIYYFETGELKIKSAKRLNFDNTELIEK